MVSERSVIGGKVAVRISSRAAGTNAKDAGHAKRSKGGIRYGVVADPAGRMVRAADGAQSQSGYWHTSVAEDKRGLFPFWTIGVAVQPSRLQ